MPKRPPLPEHLHGWREWAVYSALGAVFAVVLVCTALILLSMNVH